MPIEIESSKSKLEKKTARSLNLSALTMPKLKARDRMFFTEQLTLLIDTGASLHEALRALSKQSENPVMKKLVQNLYDEVTEGKSFSKALSNHPQLFSSTYVNLISASEQGGFMVDVLKELLEMDEKKEKLQSTLVSALSYPVFLLVFSLAVVIFVLVVVFPKFGDLFLGIKDQLPSTTIVLMAASELLIERWLPIIIGLFGAAFGFRWWINSPSGVLRFDRWKLSLPGVRSIFSQLYLVQSFRVMSLSLKNGVSITDTLEACRGVVKNKIYQQLMNSLETNVIAGAGIAIGFQESKIIPELVKTMVITGEETGNLAKVMGKIADYYENELQKKVMAISKLAEPIMLLVMGLVVGILVSSLILPIFKLSRAVN